MRRAMLLFAVLAAASCKREPSFDEKYNMAANNIEQRAAGIDHQLNTAEPAVTNAR